MNRRTRARLVAPALIVLACCATGCTAPDADDTTMTPSPSPSPSASAAPSPTPTAAGFDIPDTADPTQVAITLKYDEGEDPSGEIIAGPAVLVADRPFTIEGQCEGDGVGFEVVTADGTKRVIADGDFDCDEPPAGEFTYQLPYAGPVQVNLTDADDVDRAWVRVVQP